MKSRRSIKRTAPSDDEGSSRGNSLPEPPSKAVTPVSQPVSSPATAKNAKDAAANKKKKGQKTNRDSGSSSDEERWLEKIKDPKMMTARQRAMYDRENNAEKDFLVPETLVSLPTGYKEKVMTAEAIERAQVKSAKRKQLADQKREKDRQKTMDRLLKKQESKLNKVNKAKQLRPGVPIITYKSTSEGSVVVFPANYELGLGESVQKLPPESKLCGVCGETPKRYNCSKTNVPLCSFKCYKENVTKQGLAVG